MTAPNSAPQGYSATQIALHWAIVVLVAAQYVFKDAIAGAWDAIQQGQTYAFDPLILAHVVGGGLILVLVAWRLVLRLRRGTPPPPDNELGVLKSLSHVAHWAFYAILGAMPVTGLLAWFAELAPAARAHSVLKVVLLALVALHILAIPFHRIVLKNNVMRRMIYPAD